MTKIARRESFDPLILTHPYEDIEEGLDRIMPRPIEPEAAVAAQRPLSRSRSVFLVLNGCAFLTGVFEVVVRQNFSLGLPLIAVSTIAIATTPKT